jgi:hypothetical protein
MKIFDGDWEGAEARRFAHDEDRYQEALNQAYEEEMREAFEREYFDELHPGWENDEIDPEDRRFVSEADVTDAEWATVRFDLTYVPSSEE